MWRSQLSWRGEEMPAETSLPNPADAVDAVPASAQAAGEPTRRYDAFISYSHARDKPIAAALQGAVQRLGKAWYQRRALRVFRDDTSLTATPHLWPSIEQALSHSRFLILLASPQAAGSPWVDKELAWWLDHNDAETVLIALTEGDLEWQPATGDLVWSEATPLPSALKGHLADEPRWIDLRPYRDNARPNDPRLGELAANFAAAIHGVPKEDLLSQEVRQQRRALRLAWSAVAALVMLSALAGWQWRVAEMQRARAEQTLAAATRAANTLIFDLAQRFRLTSGVPVDVIRSILRQARQLQASLLRTGQVSADLRDSEAAALTAMSTTLLQQGDIAGALPPAERARQIVEGLIATEGASAVREDALSVIDNQIGDTLLAENRVAEARTAYRKSLAIIDKLAAGDPQNRFWQAGLATSYGRMGRLQARDGRLKEALGDLRKSVAIYESLAAAGWDKAGNQGLAAFADEQIGDVQMLAGRPAAALAAYRKCLALFETLGEGNPRDSGWQHGRAVCAVSVGDALAAEGKAPDALTVYRKALSIAATLAAANPSDALWHKDLATAHERIGDVLGGAGETAQALTEFGQSLALFRSFAASNPADAHWQRDLGLLYQKIGEQLLAQGKTAEAQAALRKSVAIREKLAASAPGNPLWQTELVVSLKELADSGDRTRPNLNRALTILRQLDAAGTLPSGKQAWIGQIKAELAKPRK